MTSCALNTAVHLSSQSFSIGISEMCVRLGMICYSHALSGKEGKSSKCALLNFTVCPFGHPT